MKPKDDIVFEDLEGNPDEVVEVDLDADEEAGIQRRVHDDAGDEDDKPPASDPKPGVKPDDKGSRTADDDRLAAAKAEAQAAREELARFRAEQADAQRQADKDAVTRITGDIEAVEQKLEAAIENGDTKAQVRLTSELTDLKARKLATESRASAPPEPKTSPAKDLKVKSWMTKNGWYNQPGKERYTRITNRIDREVAAEGYDPASDEYWNEIDFRLKREAPELYEQAPPSPPPRDKRGEDRVAGVGDEGGGQSRRVNSNRVKLDRADFRVMRKFGLDPSNPAHVKEFARNKQEAEREESRRQRA